MKEDVITEVEKLVNELKELADYRNKSEEEKEVIATNKLIDKIKTCIKIDNSQLYSVVWRGLHWHIPIEARDSILNNPWIVNLLKDKEVTTDEDINSFVGNLASVYLLLTSQNIRYAQEIEDLKSKLAEYEKPFWKKIF